MITVLDYGMGNLRSVEKAVQASGGSVRISSNLQGAEKLIIPGVGAFGAAMERLGPLREEIRTFAEAGQPLLGICLGQQLLFERSEEMGEHAGLGIIGGDVRYFSKEMGLKVPHIGWSSLHYMRREGLALKSEEGEQTYFVHSLYTECADAEDVLATATYGVEFAAAVSRKNIWGTQFHPEKSSAVGLRMLRQFIEC